MAQARLSKRTADQFAAETTVAYLFDTDLPGFFLRATPTGAKAWGFQFRAGSGRGAAKKRVTIAAYGKMTPEEARSAARRLAGNVAKGADPAEEKAARAREMRVEALIDLYALEGCVVQRGKRIGEPMKPMTRAYTLARLRHHAVPILGTRRLSELGTADVERLAREITAGKTARDVVLGPRRRVIVRGGEGAARKVVRDLSAVFTFAVRRRLMLANPVATAAVRKTDNARERFLSLEEIGRLGQAFDRLESEGVNPKALNIARLWALTGARRNEIAGLRWAEIDAVRGLLMLGATKTGRSVRPLGAAALAVLATIQIEGDSPFVFPGSKRESFYQGTKDVWPRITKLADLPGVTPHTLRHTNGGTATSTGEALALTGAILGHANARSTQIYAHVSRDPARQAADRVSRQIAEAMAGEGLSESKGGALMSDDVPAWARPLLRGPIEVDGHTTSEALSRELGERLDALMTFYGCDPSPDGWRELALRLALDHQIEGVPVMKVVVPVDRQAEAGGAEPGKSWWLAQRVRKEGKRRGSIKAAAVAMARKEGHNARTLQNLASSKRLPKPRFIQRSSWDDFIHASLDEAADRLGGDHRSVRLFS